MNIFVNYYPSGGGGGTCPIADDATGSVLWTLAEAEPNIGEPEMAAINRTLKNRKNSVAYIPIYDYNRTHNFDYNSELSGYCIDFKARFPWRL
jgi:hypothetical protein